MFVQDENRVAGWILAHGWLSKATARLFAYPTMT